METAKLRLQQAERNQKLFEALFKMGGLVKLEIQAEDDPPLYQRHLEDQLRRLRLWDVHALKANATPTNRSTIT